MKCNACEHENLEGAHFCAKCGAILPLGGGGEDALIGQVIGGRYRITRVLGEGGMGVVYEAEQQLGTSLRKVAVKTLHKHLSTDASVQARFHRECGVIAELEHPNTVRVYDFGSTPDGTLYIAMEFLKGQPLHELIEATGPLPPERVVKIVQQIVGSLAEAHGKGIIHRDLKPDNVLLTERAGEHDVVKLLDFGIAARTESADTIKEKKLTQQGMVLGTPPYMSPEQFAGKELDARSDIYSLGIVVYEMLTADLPFKAETAWQWATEHMTATPKALPATTSAGPVPSGMRAAVMRALSKEKEARQSSVAEFLKELSQRSTVIETAGSAGVSPAGATAMMEAAPDFGGAYKPAVAATAVMPHAATISAPVAAVPTGRIAPESGPKRVSKWPVAIVGAVLLAAGGVAAITLSRGSGDNPATEELLQPAPPPTTLQPLDAPASLEPGAPAEASKSPGSTAPAASPASKTPTRAPDPATEAPPPTPSVVPTSPPSVPPPATVAPTVAPTPPPPTPTPTPPPPTPPPPPPAPSDSAAVCRQCIAAASASDFQGAAAAYARCQIPEQKALCKRTASQRGTRAAQAAAAAGKCSEVALIAAAAASMGWSTSKLQQVQASCK